ncbi:hypothetical protein FN846DRAFT_997641 [Sphaerosporella brunnea]|uniref:Uncharacterized protein n=1 Tax=Sphaerosporella brunnea TaxID=1250544 RepID=A0A5J5EJD0_9PEZI|nr:hypothetical protein FN846DRAFT_997641 [Sphaerosporella brunnea]
MRVLGSSQRRDGFEGVFRSAARAGELGVVFDGGTGAVPPDDLGGTTPTPATTLATVTSAGTSTSATATAIATDSASGPTSTPSSETSATHTSNHSSSGSSYHSSSSDHSSDSEHDSASTEGSSSKRTSPAIIATAVVVTLVALGFLGGFFFWRRRKQRLKRLSINTFIDKYEPQIGGPLDARREKLPDFLNDILRANESPGIITGGPPVAASSSAQEPNPPNPPQNPFRSPGASPKPPPSMVSRGLPAFPKPRSRSGDVPPVPTIPPSPQPTRTAATTPATRTQSVLSAISEVSLGGNSPNTQVELRMAYQALKREVGARDDVESEWGGTTVISQDAGALSRRGF